METRGLADQIDSQLGLESNVTINLNPKKHDLPTHSAGILLFKRKPHLQLLLAHPGGPYWWNKDEGAWSIPKGEIEEGEELLHAAKREFREEIGFVPDGEFIELGSIKQKGGKTVYAWAIPYQIPDNFIFDPSEFEMEWPPNSGKTEHFPEIDRIEYFSPFEARKKINVAQREFINRLIGYCSRSDS